MPNPEALARLVKYADRLPGAAALIAAASILAKELIELASGDAGALDPRSSMAMLLSAKRWIERSRIPPGVGRHRAREKGETAGAGCRSRAAGGE